MIKTCSKQEQSEAIHILLKNGAKTSILEVNTNTELTLDGQMFVSFINRSPKCQLELYVVVHSNVGKYDTMLTEEVLPKNIIMFRKNKDVGLLTTITNFKKRNPNKGDVYIFSITLSERYIIKPSTQEYLDFVNTIKNKSLILEKK